MPNDTASSHHLTTIGIECESIEEDQYGVARLIRKLLEQLASRPELTRTHRFVLYFNGRIPDNALLRNPLFQIKQIGLSRWGLPRSFSLYYYILLPLELWRHPVDAMYWPNYMLPLIAPPRIPSLVMLTEDVWHAIHNRQVALRYRIAYAIFGYWAAWRATRITAISHASQSALTTLFRISPDRIIVNELAVDPRQGDEAGDGAHTILFVGQAFERRHLRETLVAFQEIAQEYPTLTFHIIGPDKYQTPIIDRMVRTINQRLARQAVTWVPRATDEALADAYRHARILVYVSDIEAFGLPPLEALSYGVPAVVADTPVNREIYGSAAFLVGTPDVSSIAHALRQSLNDTGKRAAIRAAAPRILARYTWRAYTDRFLQGVRAMINHV